MTPRVQAQDQLLHRWHGLSEHALRAHQRRRLIGAAGELLISGGYAAMTLQAVARRAHVTMRDAYFSVSSREQLAADVYSDAAELFVAAVKRSCDESTADPIAAGIAALVAALSEQPIRAELVLREHTPPGNPYRLARAATTETMVGLLRSTDPAITPLHARIICGGLRITLAQRFGVGDPADLTDEMTMLARALLGRSYA